MLANNNMETYAYGGFLSASDEKLCFIFVGFPGSGKSTFRETILLDHPRAKIASSDDFIEYYARRKHKSYSEVFKYCIDYADIYANMVFDNAIGLGDSIIVDRTNMSKKSRRKWLSRLPSDYTKIAIVFDTDSQTLDEVNKSRMSINRSIPLDVFKSMAESYQAPDLQEFDRVISYNWKKDPFDD